MLWLVVAALVGVFAAGAVTSRRPGDEAGNRALVELARTDCSMERDGVVAMSFTRRSTDGGYLSWSTAAGPLIEPQNLVKTLERAFDSMVARQELETASRHRQQLDSLGSLVRWGGP